MVLQNPFYRLYNGNQDFLLFWMVVFNILVNIFQILKQQTADTKLV